MIAWNSVSEAAITAPRPRADSSISVIEAVIPPSTVPRVRRTPWLTPCETHSRADGPGDTISAPARETYSNQRFQDIAPTRLQTAKHSILGNPHALRPPERAANPSHKQVAEHPTFFYVNVSTRAIHPTLLVIHKEYIPHDRNHHPVCLARRRTRPQAQPGSPLMALRPLLHQVPAIPFKK